MKRISFIISLLVCISQVTFAQLSFPNGNELNLKSNIEFMYNETGVYFHTGKNKVTDYNWIKLMQDSLDPRWDFQACMNGDCKVGLPQQGPFITDFGINDTTGFIKFHVYTAQFDGASTLYYMVAHKTDTTDKAILRFHIEYKNTTGVNEEKGATLFSTYPNPASQVLYLNNLKQTAGMIRVVAMDGKLIQTVKLTGSSLQTLDISELTSGLYHLEIESNSLISHQLIQVRK